MNKLYCYCVAGLNWPEVHVMSFCFNILTQEKTQFQNCGFTVCVLLTLVSSCPGPDITALVDWQKTPVYLLTVYALAQIQLHWLTGHKTPVYLQFMPWPCPWYNRTGWLGVKHQFTYLQFMPWPWYNCTGWLGVKHYLLTVHVLALI